MERSRILIIGATGYIGSHIAKASLALGHPTFLLVRNSTSAASNSQKHQLLESLLASGANILHGSLEDFWSLVDAIKKVDVVISAIGGGGTQTQLPDSCMHSFVLQHNIIKAIKQVGTIKRFLPAEFGNDVDRSVNAVEPAKSSYFAVKAELRRAIEGQGIPYTYVCCNCFGGLFVSNLGQRGLRVHPRDEVEILGNGNGKAVFMSEEDVGIFTIKAVDDERTLNRTLHFRPPPNTLSFNELVALWEKKIGKTLHKIFIEEDQLLKKIAEAPFAVGLLLSLRYSFFVKGEQSNFKIGGEGVEVSALYPNMKYTTIEEYLDQYV